MTPLEKAYNEYKSLPMPNKRYLDTSKYKAEEGAIRIEVGWLARKHGVTFKALEGYIEKHSGEDKSMVKETIVFKYMKKDS